MAVSAPIRGAHRMVVRGQRSAAAHPWTAPAIDAVGWLIAPFLALRIDLRRRRLRRVVMAADVLVGLRLTIRVPVLVLMLRILGHGCSVRWRRCAQRLRRDLQFLPRLNLVW